jgi:hypothetical protein
LKFAGPADTTEGVDDKVSADTEPMDEVNLAGSSDPEDEVTGKDVDNEVLRQEVEEDVG